MQNTNGIHDEEYLLDEELLEIGRLLSQTKSYAIDPRYKENLRCSLLELFMQGTTKMLPPTSKKGA